MRTVFLSLILPLAAVAAEPPNFPPPNIDSAGLGRHLCRSMGLLASSTPAKPNRVRVLFYGQSITETAWTDKVVADLKKRFPSVEIVAENRALAGFSSQLLVKTAESDLYPFEPDLLVFHVYGAHNTYEDIIRRTRERTVADVLMQTDHVTKPADFTEQTDPAKLPPRGDHWDAFMNHNWLPSVAKKYDCELCDQRAAWKNYLKANKLEPKVLLRDSVHLNAGGFTLMAACVEASLRFDPKACAGPPDDRVRDLVIGSDVKPEGGKLKLAFAGTRVDLVFDAKSSANGTVLIGGKKPSEIASAYYFTRALAKPGGQWPVVDGFGWEKLPVAEEWTMDLAQDPTNPKRFTFSLRGSVTGEDGSGASDKAFTSKSGRVKILPEHWNVEYALALTGIRPIPTKFVVTWKAVLGGRDGWEAVPPKREGLEETLTLARGLANGKHTLELTGDLTGVKAVRVYWPPFGRAK